ncbi:PLDc N-terminal domain-containing protein [Rhizohabitans arisaemae]|uniref:PLDc N-terminal domain-containing protein n=1 Tax=Rhizohabitans arisaemae TaxID=2720610 RepID=UPI0024B09E0A|nr:PLDc N-terminal domain-containing protein [Rhizohabitans arisaemae]
MPTMLVGLAILALWLYCLFDVITTPDEETRNLPKLLWVLVIVLVPLAGSLLWLLLGRASRVRTDPSVEPRNTVFPPERAPREAPRGPDDDPDFLRDLDRRLKGETD